MTAGGLSCMAVQGGLLASSLANQVEKDLQNRPMTQVARPQLAAPIAIFLLAKLVAYTLLGVLLGALGSTLSLSPMMRAILQFAIGIFMIGNALRMFNVHPLFRYFTFETPSFVTRFIRKSSKGKTALAAPVFLGAMTVLIPCGISQSMMAVALGTANPLAGAAILFAFTLGASPAFFAVAYFAARMGAVLEKQFMRLVAVVLLILGGYAIDSGLNLSGAPVSLTTAFQAFSDFANPSASAHNIGSNDSIGDMILLAKNEGYEPRTVYAKANQDNQLTVLTLNTTSCSLAFTIPELGIEKTLPVTGKAIFDIPSQPEGKVIRYACSMGMYTGQIVFR
ncbi:MAG: sulfite exporter TauE/SafE family protein [Chloroflexi bacterium]|nr:sulfite exporter TauE/SafE family protein [Chloroflexota bacterium]